MIELGRGPAPMGLGQCLGHGRGARWLMPAMKQWMEDQACHPEQALERQTMRTGEGFQAKEP